MTTDSDTIMKPIIEGDMETLEKLSAIVDDFPAGKDNFIDRHWIIHAIDCGTFEVIEWMVHKNTPLIFRDDEGKTVLHSAIEREKPDKYEVMKLLIKAGADLNAKGMNDYTPAHKAAVRSDLEGLRLLKEAGADFSIKTEIDEYETPLGEAIVMKSSEEVIEYLQSQ